VQAGGLELQPDGDRRWLLVEVGRPPGDDVVATLVRADAGVVFEHEAGPPVGPYSRPEDALIAYEQWRLAAWNGDRP
jgi:hypothetical protein